MHNTDNIHHFRIVAMFCYIQNNNHILRIVPGSFTSKHHIIATDKIYYKAQRSWYGASLLELTRALVDLDILVVGCAALLFLDLGNELLLRCILCIDLAK